MKRQNAPISLKNFKATTMCLKKNIFSIAYRRLDGCNTSHGDGFTQVGARVADDCVKYRYGTVKNFAPKWCKIDTNLSVDF
jgi:hypothetical protein